MVPLVAASASAIDFTVDVKVEHENLLENRLGGGSPFGWPNGMANVDVDAMDAAVRRRRRVTQREECRERFQ